MTRESMPLEDALTDTGVHFLLFSAGEDPNYGEVGFRLLFDSSDKFRPSSTKVPATQLRRMPEEANSIAVSRLTYGDPSQAFPHATLTSKLHILRVAPPRTSPVGSRSVSAAPSDGPILRGTCDREAVSRHTLDGFQQIVLSCTFFFQHEYSTCQRGSEVPIVNLKTRRIGLALIVTTCNWRKLRWCLSNPAFLRSQLNTLLPTCQRKAVDFWKSFSSGKIVLNLRNDKDLESCALQLHSSFASFLAPHKVIQTLSVTTAEDTSQHEQREPSDGLYSCTSLSVPHCLKILWMKDQRLVVQVVAGAIGMASYGPTVRHDGSLDRNTETARRVIIIGENLVEAEMFLTLCAFFLRRGMCTQTGFRGPIGVISSNIRAEHLLMVYPQKTLPKEALEQMLLTTACSAVLVCNLSLGTVLRYTVSREPQDQRTLEAQECPGMPMTRYDWVAVDAAQCVSHLLSLLFDAYCRPTTSAAPTRSTIPMEHVCDTLIEQVVSQSQMLRAMVRADVFASSGTAKTHQRSPSALTGSESYLHTPQLKGETAKRSQSSLLPPLKLPRAASPPQQHQIAKSLHIGGYTVDASDHQLMLLIDAPVM